MPEKNQKRILIIDDVAGIHEDFRRIFSGDASNTKFDEALAAISNTTTSAPKKTESAKYILDSAYQGEEALKLVEKSIANNERYALAFVDMRMPPGWNGIMTIKKIWEVDPEIQIVICTAFSDYSWEDISHELTTTDNFLILKKPFDVVEIRQLAASLTTKWELKRKVQYQVEHLQELVEERSQQLLHQATHDELTGLPNRSLNHDRIQQAIAYAKQDNTLVAVLMLDLDNFKRINDRLGQNIGDALLKDIADKLKNILQETDSICRIGGDEFSLVITSYDNEAELQKRINRIFALFTTPSRVNSHELIVTSSIGVSIYPKDGEDVDTLLKNANIALYHAKEMGRNNVQYYQTPLGQELFEKMDVISSLHQALANGEFVLHYQPLLDLNTNKIIGVEALVRWNHPQLGLLQPDTFIPLAEKSGLINELGKWVLKAACLQNKKWQQTINPELNVAINISGYQFRKKEFIEETIQLLQELEIDPHTITFEMTESVILGNPNDIADKMHQLKKIGIHFAIDDFGTGYSTLNYLKYYPFDSIKIDKSFIQGVITNKGDKSIVEAIINMARTLGVMILAEGVESIEQVNFLKDRHADHVQGYFYSKPVDADKCTELLKNASGKQSITSE